MCCAVLAGSNIQAAIASRGGVRSGPNEEAKKGGIKPFNNKPYVGGREGVSV